MATKALLRSSRSEGQRELDVAGIPPLAPRGKRTRYQALVCGPLRSIDLRHLDAFPDDDARQVHLNGWSPRPWGRGRELLARQPIARWTCWRTSSNCWPSARALGNKDERHPLPNCLG